MKRSVLSTVKRAIVRSMSILSNRALTQDRPIGGGPISPFLAGRIIQLVREGWAVQNCTLSRIFPDWLPLVMVRDTCGRIQWEVVGSQFSVFRAMVRLMNPRKHESRL
jgi:hypothetical protein